MHNKYLFKSNNISYLLNNIKEHDYLLLFLDYDGTLAPFHRDPSRAKPLPGLEKILAELQADKQTIITIISGRGLDDLKKMISIPGLNYAGNHGLKILFNNGVNFNWLRENTDFTYSQYNNIKKGVKEKISISENIRFEDKGSGFCLHLENEKNESLQNKLQEQIQNIPFELLAGRKIIEVRPAGWDKGKALKYMLNKFSELYTINNYYIIYVGDDSTDEDVFQVLNKGTGIYVQNKGDLKTSADYYLHHPGDVFKLLEILKYHL